MSVTEEVQALAKLLKEAGEAHHVFEETHGKDEDWPGWYASYILARGFRLVPSVPPSLPLASQVSQDQGEDFGDFHTWGGPSFPQETEEEVKRDEEANPCFSLKRGGGIKWEPSHLRGVRGGIK